MAQIYNFQGFGAQYAPNFQTTYNNMNYYQNPQIYFSNPIPSCNYKFFNILNDSTNIAAKEEKVIIDLENTQIHSKCDGSELSEKQQNNFTDNIIETDIDPQSHQNSLKQTLKQENIVEKQVEDTFENLISINIFKSSVLNPKCNFCSQTLLCSNTSLEWDQCHSCLEMFHKPCEIVNSQIRALCKTCSSRPVQQKIPIKKVIRKIKNQRKQKKSHKSNLKLFKNSQSPKYLDSFLNSFGYRLGISELQIQKQIQKLNLHHKKAEITQLY